MVLEPPALERFTISSRHDFTSAAAFVDGMAKSEAETDGNRKINKSLSMFWPAGDFLLPAGHDNCCRLNGIGRMAPIFRKMRNFHTFLTGLRSGVFDTENA